jgi:two-component system LytT family response regulator
MAEKIRTVLVDDESASIIMLRNLLETYFPIIQIEGTAETVNEAVPLINTTRPELVFLDINLPDGEGFDVISRVNVRDFQIIFITAYDKYAVKAFEFSALHFIVKPVTFEGLKTAIDRFNKETKGGIEEKINVLRDTLKSRYEKIIISSSAGLNIIKISDVLRLEADDVYTLFYLVNGQRLIASKPLNNYERILVLCYV